MKRIIFEKHNNNRIFQLLTVDYSNDKFFHRWISFALYTVVLENMQLTRRPTSAIRLAAVWPTTPMSRRTASAFNLCIVWKQNFDQMWVGVVRLSVRLFKIDNHSNWKYCDLSTAIKGNTWRCSCLKSDHRIISLTNYWNYIVLLSRAPAAALARAHIRVYDGTAVPRLRIRALTQFIFKLMKNYCLLMDN